MSPFSLFLLVGTCSAFLDLNVVHDGVKQRPSLTSVLPPFQRSPNSLFFHNSAWHFPTRPLLPPQPTFPWNRQNSGAHPAFPGFSNNRFKNFVSPRPFPPFHVAKPAFAPNLLSSKKEDLDFFNHELDHVTDIISPLLNFFHRFLDSSIDIVLPIEGDNSGIGTEKLDPSMEENASQWNVNHDDILDDIFENDDMEEDPRQWNVNHDDIMDEIFEDDDIGTIYPNVDKEFGSPNFNLTKDMEEDYEDVITDSHFDDILEEIFESPEDDDSDIGTKKLYSSMEEDASQRNVNLDDILDEIFEGDDIENDDVVTNTAVIENARDAIPVYNIIFPCPHSLSELEEIFENDNSQMLDSIDSTVEKDNVNVVNALNEIPENDANEMLYPDVEKHSDLESSNLTKEAKEDEIIDTRPEADFENEIKNAKQKQDDSTEEDIGYEFEPTIILFR